MLGSVLENILKAYPRAYITASVPSCAIRSVVQIMLRSVLEIFLGGVPGNILEVYLEASSGCTREHIIKQVQNVLLSGMGSILEIVLEIRYGLFHRPVYTQRQLLQYTHCTGLKPTSISLQVSIS